MSDKGYSICNTKCNHLTNTSRCLSSHLRRDPEGVRSGRWAHKELAGHGEATYDRDVHTGTRRLSSGWRVRELGRNEAMMPSDGTRCRGLLHSCLIVQELRLHLLGSWGLGP